MFLKPSRWLAAGLISLSLLAGTSPAYAGPPPVAKPSSQADHPGVIPAPKHDPSGGKKYTWNLSSGEWSMVKRATKALDPAHTNRAGQIDFNWIRSSFGKHSSERDAFAAGVWYRRKDWKQFTHLRKIDKQRIIRWAQTHSGPNPKSLMRGESLTGTNVIAQALVESTTPSGRAKMRAMAPKPCLGKTATAYNKDDKLYWLYMNSCDTNNLVDLLDTGVEIIGVLGAIFGVVTQGLAAIPAAVWGGELWILKKYVENRQNASDLDAVIFRFSLNVGKSKYGRYYAPMRIFPQ